jgi:hypothetical protein
MDPLAVRMCVFVSDFRFPLFRISTLNHLNSHFNLLVVHAKATPPECEGGIIEDRD